MRLRVYVRSRMVRAEDVNTGKVIIARLDKGLLWGINEVEKTYTELTLMQIAEDVQKARRAAGFVEDDKATVTIQEDSTPETISGYTCKKFTLYVGGQAVMSLWNSLALEIPEKDDLYDYTESLGEFSTLLIQKARSLPGFPMRMRAVKTVGAGKVVAFREIAVLRREPLDPKLFELPKGLTKVEVKPPDQVGVPK